VTSNVIMISAVTLSVILPKCNCDECRGTNGKKTVDLLGQVSWQTNFVRRYSKFFRRQNVVDTKRRIDGRRRTDAGKNLSTVCADVDENADVAILCRRRGVFRRNLVGLVVAWNEEKKLLLLNYKNIEIKWEASEKQLFP
jgi:hypothetical protein